MRQHVQRLRRDGAHFQLISDIKQAVLTGTLQIPMDRNIDDTDVIFKVLTPVHGMEKSYGINSM